MLDPVNRGAICRDKYNQQIPITEGLVRLLNRGTFIPLVKVFTSYNYLNSEDNLLSTSAFYVFPFWLFEWEKRRASFTNNHYK